MINIIKKIFSKKKKTIIDKKFQSNLYLNILLKNKWYYCKYFIVQIKQQNGKLKCLAKLIDSNIDKEQMESLKMYNFSNQFVAMPLDYINRYTAITKSDIPIGMVSATLGKKITDFQKQQVKVLYKNKIIEYLHSNIEFK